MILGLFDENNLNGLTESPSDPLVKDVRKGQRGQKIDNLHCTCKSQLSKHFPLVPKAKKHKNRHKTNVTGITLRNQESCTAFGAHLSDWGRLDKLCIDKGSPEMVRRVELLDLDRKSGMIDVIGVGEIFRLVRPVIENGNEVGKILL